MWIHQASQWRMSACPFCCLGDFKWRARMFSFITSNRPNLLILPNLNPVLQVGLCWICSTIESIWQDNNNYLYESSTLFFDTFYNYETNKSVRFKVDHNMIWYFLGSLRIKYAVINGQSGGENPKSFEYIWYIRWPLGVKSMCTIISGHSVKEASERPLKPFHLKRHT